MHLKPPSETVVLVTGASGYLGSHVVWHLLREGFRVRGAVRTLSSSNPKVDLLRQLNTEDRLELVEADLLEEKGWLPAVEGCDCIIHTASPFLPAKARDSMVKTAIDGTLNVLKAAAASTTVRKVVLTSCCTSDMSEFSKTFTDRDWLNLDSRKVDIYARSKTLAEKAAWNFVENNVGNRFTLTTIVPSFIVGPPLISGQGASVQMVQKFLNNEHPGITTMQMPCVDVRDVAKSHCEALRRPESDGERIIVTVTPGVWVKDIAKLLKEEFENQGYKITCYCDTKCCIKSLFTSKSAIEKERLILEMHFDNTKARKLLGMEFMDPVDSIMQMSYALIEAGIVKKTKQYRGPTIRMQTD